MKIYTEIILDMTSDSLDILKENFYEYKGEIAKCEEYVKPIFEPMVRNVQDVFTEPGGGLQDIFSDPTRNPFSPVGPVHGADPLDLFGFRGEGETEDQLTVPTGGTTDLGTLNTNLEEFQLAQQGFRRRPDGSIEEIPDDQLDALVGGNTAARIKNERAIGRLGQERTLAALQGNLPVSPALERDIQKREEQTRLGLRRGAGVGSTAGIQKLGQLQESSDIARERVRTGEVTSGQARDILQQQTLGNLQAQALQGFRQGRAAEAQLGFQQQELATQVQLANLAGRFGQQAGRQQQVGRLGTLGLLAYAASDRKLKENIKDLDSTTKIIEKMKPVSFKYKSDGRSSKGFIAQDLQKILPEAVIEIDGKGTLGIDYSVVTAVLIKAFQEFKNELESQ